MSNFFIYKLVTLKILKERAKMYFNFHVRIFQELGYMTMNRKSKIAEIEFTYDRFSGKAQYPEESKKHREAE